MKEHLGLTEIQKQTIRISFGEIKEDAYQKDLGFSLGHLGKASSGHTCQTQVKEATKARISKALQKTWQKQSARLWGQIHNSAACAQPGARPSHPCRGWRS